MNTPELEHIAIVEPPLRELNKRHSWLGASCFGGCGIIVLLIAISITCIKLFLGPGPSESSKIPENFPSSTIPVYDENNIDRVVTIPGRYTARGIHLSAIIPDLLLNRLYTDSESTSEIALPTSTIPRSVQTLWEDLRTPTTNYTVTTRFEWRDLEAEPTFIRSFYEQALEKNGFIIENEIISKSTQQFTFHNIKSGITGSLFIEKTSTLKRTGTARVIFTVKIPEQPTQFQPENLAFPDNTSSSSTKPSHAPLSH